MEQFLNVEIQKENLLNSEIEKPNKYGWNVKIETVAKRIGEQSRLFKIMHLKVAQKYYRQYFALMITGIVLGPIAGVLSGVGAILDPDRDPTIPLLASCFSFISGIVVAIIKFGKYDEAS